MNQEVWSLLSLKRFFQTREKFFVVAYLNIQYENYSYFDENFVIYLLMGDCNVNLLNIEIQSFMTLCHHISLRHVSFSQQIKQKKFKTFIDYIFWILSNSTHILVTY